MIYYQGKHRYCL